MEAVTAAGFIGVGSFTKRMDDEAMRLFRPCIARWWLVLLVLAAVPAQAQAPMTLPRLAGPVALDGPSDEAAWQQVAPLPLTMSLPTFEGEFTERTEIRVAYDDAYLYAALRAYDATPQNIRGNSLSRDRGSESDDYFGLILDSFNDNENALAFLTTPAGIRVDWTIFNDAQFDGGAMPINESWNTFWDAAVSVTDAGWFAEMRIPFSSLRFQDAGGRVVMGLSTWRWISHKSELQTFPEAPPKWFFSHIKPSIMRDVVFEDVHSRKPLYLTPYALGGLGQAADLNAAETAYERHDDVARDLGLDLKYGLTSNLTLDLTLNTDFAQVEADDQQVNLTRFSLFFPEKRLFFQERSSIFDFNTGGATRLFYSRRIGLSDEGPVRIYGGARLVGRLGRWDVGLLDVQTARSDALSSENFGVLRLRRQVLNAYSYAGGMLTSRLGPGGAFDLAYGLDGVLRLFGDDYLTFSLAHTLEDSLVQAGRASPFDAGLARVRWERRSNEGLGYAGEVKASGAHFDPGVGFALRTDVTQASGQLAYTVLAGEASSFFQHQVALAGAAFLRNGDGSVESAEVGPSYLFSLKAGAFGVVNPKVSFEDLREPFELSDDVVIPAGRYTFFGVAGAFQPPPRLFRPALSFEAGSFYDGWRVTASFSPTWTLSRYLELRGEYQLNRARFPDRDARFDADLFRLRATAALDAHLSASTFAQYNTFTDAVVVNVRLRYNVREGHDLYLVYNEALNTDRRAEAPPLPLTESRTILVKYTYTFVL